MQSRSNKEAGVQNAYLEKTTTKKPAVKAVAKPVAKVIAMPAPMPSAPMPAPVAIAPVSNVIPMPKKPVRRKKPVAKKKPVVKASVKKPAAKKPAAKKPAPKMKMAAAAVKPGQESGAQEEVGATRRVDILRQDATARPSQVAPFAFGAAAYGR